MRHFEKLRALNAFEKQHFDFLGTLGDHRLISEIGYHQAKSKPLTLKQLFLLDVGSIATVQRRLRRLKELGIVQHRRSASDRRAVELTLSPKCVRIFAKYDTLMSSKPPAPDDAAPGRGEPSHVCGLCDSDAGRRKLLVTFLAQGLKRGDTCLLVAPADVQKTVLAELDPRKASKQLVVWDGRDSADAQLAFLKRTSREAKQAGQGVHLVGDMSWIFSKNLPIDAMLDIEKRLDAMARRLSLRILCVYDARHFSSGDFLRAVKCHRDHSHHPIALG